MHQVPTTKRILAIESSCDETAASIVEGDGQSLATARSNVIASQVALHAEFGGVFPDLAAQEHTKKILPTISLALHEAGLTSSANASGHEIQQAIAALDAIAVTVGPGLIGSLLIGTNAAAQLAALANKPILPINHWEGHLYSIFLEHESNSQSLPQFPMLTLTVSGGHTSLILMRNHFDYEVVGSTVDDAAGEAFDKCARLLELGYPGGPALSKAAAEARASNQQLSIKLPRPMINSGNLKFSFSGLKTAVLYAIQRGDIKLPQDQAAGAREVEDSIVETLITKTLQAAKEYQPASLALVGGVAANSQLRSQLTEQAKAINLPLYIAPMPFTTDNAAMIGAAAIFRLAHDPTAAKLPTEIHATASLRLG
ncbi:MAG: tRNA (adenosine(37)-N6)-threonylcarbamoyltransferase complex transferase subunit TsaD [Patescibacteria group bacterium]